MSSPVLWQPTADYIAQTNVHRFMERLDARIDWVEPYTRVLDGSSGPEWAR